MKGKERFRDTLELRQKGEEGMEKVKKAVGKRNTDGFNKAEVLPCSLQALMQHIDWGEEIWHNGLKFSLKLSCQSSSNAYNPLKGRSL